MKKQALFLSISILLIVGCGDETNFTRVDERTGFEVVQNMDGLGKCDSLHVADIAYVKDSAKTFFCNGKNWRTVDGVDGKDGKDGVDGKNGKDGKNGVDGDVGSTCSVSSSGDIYTLVCGWDTITVNTHLVTPSSCETEKNDDGMVTLKCGGRSATTIRGQDGEDASLCKYVDNEDGTMLQVCGDVSVVLYGDFCGETPYDPDEQFCYGVNLYDRCGGKVYDPELQTCDSSGTVPVVRENCGEGYLYDPATQSCVTGNLVLTKCGDQPYNVFAGFCFEGQVYLYCKNAVLTEYDPRKYHCEGGYISGTVMDKDSNVYRTVKFGGTEWMTENYRLNVKGSLCASEFADTVSYEEHPEMYGKDQEAYEFAKSVDCDKNGRVYNWVTVMDLDEKYADGYVDGAVSQEHQGICPEGWHVPEENDFYMLAFSLSSNPWANDFIENGTGGFNFEDGAIKNYYKTTYFYSTTEGGIIGDPVLASVFDALKRESFFVDGKRDYNALRCVKNVMDVAEEGEGE